VLETKPFGALVVFLKETGNGTLELVRWAKKSGCAESVVAMADSPDATVHQQATECGVDLFLEDVANFEEVVKSVVPPPEDVQDTFSGIVEGVDILDYVQFLLLAGRTTVLEVYSNQGARGRLFIHKGEIFHASLGNLQGEEALMACLSFRGGSFSNLPWRQPDARTITKPGDFLLMEAARKRDELQAGHDAGVG
jgi:hypothetical protein